MFRKRQNSLSRYFASEGKIAKKDILSQEAKLDESANCLAGHGQVNMKRLVILKITTKEVFDYWRKILEESDLEVYRRIHDKSNEAEN